MKSLAKYLPLLSVLAASACGGATYVPGQSYSREEVEKENQRRDGTLEKRAAFEFKCEGGQPIRVRCLDTQVDGFCVTAGVEACGQRGIYLWVQTSQFRADWVLDAANLEKQKQE